jgi:hypothetical protein
MGTTASRTTGSPPATPPRIPALRRTSQRIQSARDGRPWR